MYIHDEALIFFTDSCKSSDAKLLATQCESAMPDVVVVVSLLQTERVLTGSLTCISFCHCNTIQFFRSLLLTIKSSDVN